jgi:hypothetical protein
MRIEIRLQKFMNTKHGTIMSPMKVDTAPEGENNARTSEH